MHDAETMHDNVNTMGGTRCDDVDSIYLTICDAYDVNDGLKKTQEFNDVNSVEVYDVNSISR